jgi:hypothetical protein
VLALAALALASGLAALAAGDAGPNAGLARSVGAVCVALLTVALIGGPSAAVQLSLALCAALLLLRRSDRLEVAPLYGFVLLMIGELAQRSRELRTPGAIAPEVVSARLAATVLVAAVGGSAATIVAIAVTLAPARSVALTAAGAAALAASCVAIVALARRAGFTASEAGEAERRTADTAPAEQRQDPSARTAPLRSRDAGSSQGPRSPNRR